MMQPAAPDASELRTDIERLKAEIDALTTERAARIKACEVPIPEEEQRACHLAGFRIEAARLSNIGPARCAVLRSWGIDTAADIDEARVADIPGFGRTLTEKLVLWRERLEAGFVYSDKATVDPLQVQAIDRQLAPRRTRLMKELRDGISELERRIGSYVKERQVLWARVEAAFEARMLARHR